MLFRSGSSDGLIVMYNPQVFELTGADKEFKESRLGWNSVQISNDYKYSNINKNEKEICFDIKDGENSTTRVDFKELKPGGTLKIFFLHDYKIPLGSPVYWEKNEVVQFK